MASAASGSTSVSNEFEKEVGSDLDCSICHELFTSPKLLPCAHTLCRHCLLSWLSSNHQPLCPLCRCAIVEPQKGASLAAYQATSSGQGNSMQGKSPEAVVDSLPDDVTMAAVVECARLLRAENVCGGCRGSPAKSICLQCGDMLCTTCTTAHGNLTATRNHKVESLSSMTAQKLSVSQPASCDQHVDRVSELYCPKHGAAICHLCASSEHRACPEVTLFEKRVLQLNAELAAMSEKLRTAETNLDKAIDGLDHQLQEAADKTNKTLAEIEQACNRLENAVQACRKRLRELALQSKKAVQNSIEVTKAGLLKRRGKITSHRLLVDRVKTSSPPGKLETVTQMICTRVSNTDVVVNSPEDDMDLVCIDFGVVKRLEKELSFLGEIHSSEKPSGLEPWKFYSSTTANVALINGGKTAERVTGNSAVVFCNVPMVSGILYEVMIEEVRGNSADIFPCGVVFSHPSDLKNKIPETTLDGWTDAIVFSDSVFVFGVEKDYDIGNRLRKLPQGTRVGFVRDSGGFIHLYINGERQWIFVKHPSKSCYVFFELMHVYRKITCLPPTSISKALQKAKSMLNLSQ